MPRAQKASPGLIRVKVLNYEYYLGLTDGEKVTVILIIFFYVSVYILINLAELFQRDADEPDVNDEGMSDQRK